MFENAIRAEQRKRKYAVLLLYFQAFRSNFPNHLPDSSNILNMTDPASVILGLPGLLTACVDCFNYVQIARNFGSDYEKCLLALDTTRLRLSRWGAAVGISDTHFPKLDLDEIELQTAHNLLESILDTFSKAEKASIGLEKVRHLQDLSGAGLPVYDPATDLGVRYQTLHRTLEGIVEKRHISTKVIKKAKWALYEKKKFDSMVAEVRGCVNELVELFPPGSKPEIAARETALCRAEAEEVNETEDLVLLHEVVSETDLVLREATDEVLRSRGFGHLVADFSLLDSAEVNVGDQNAPGRQSMGHTVRKFVTSGNSVLNVGNINS
jgi:hypothetical protein